MALSQYLSEHPEVRKISLMLDNDEAGRMAADKIMESLDRCYEAEAVFPVHGKDFNDELQWMKRRAVER